MSRAYQLWDVFTSTPLTGNPLAVVPRAEGMSDETMQAVAREFNLSETSFVLPSEVADVRARFFTPQRELPMAGHPSIGTVYALEREGGIPKDSYLVGLELQVGVIKMGLERRGRKLSSVWMNQGIPELGEIVRDRGMVATALGLAVSELEGSLPVQFASAGVLFVLVPVASLRALAQARISQEGIERLVGDKGAGVFVFARGEGDAHVRCRMFGEALGVVEDPATGSAHGPLGAYLAEHGALAFEAETASFVSRQGVEMGRPSRLEVGVRRLQEGYQVYVGGSAVLVGEGELYL